MNTIKQLEMYEWSYNWGFKLSLSKSCFVTLTNKKRLDAQNIKLYGESIEKIH